MIFDGPCNCGPEETSATVTACGCGKPCNVEIGSLEAVHVDGEHWNRGCYKKTGGAA